MDYTGRLAPKATELVDHLAILLVVRHFLGMDVIDSRSLRYDSHVRMQHFVRQTIFFVPFRSFWGDVRRILMQRLSATPRSWHSRFLLPPRRF
jgi:hypothetical protein